MSRPQVNLQNLSQAHWNETENANVRMIADFVQNLMNEHNFDYIRSNYGNHNYVQHNRSLPEGILGLADYLETFTKKFPEYSYDVKYIMASNDMVMFHSHVTTKAKNRGNEKQGFIIMDRWRIEDGQIVEHWDSIQALNGFFRFYQWMSGGKISNSNGIF